MTNSSTGTVTTAATDAAGIASFTLTEVASPLSSSASMADGGPYKYIGYYAGAAAVSNGSLKKQVNLNMTVITHIPRIRMIFSVRLETTLYDYGRNLSQYGDGSPRGYLLDSS